MSSIVVEWRKERKMELIFGGTGSGKSAYGESVACSYMDSFQGEKIYLATMCSFGKSGAEKIARHRLLRQGKGFRTVERQRNLRGLFCQEQGQKDWNESVVLLECLGNLFANEMFSQERDLFSSIELENSEHICETGKASHRAMENSKNISEIEKASLQAMENSKNSKNSKNISETGKAIHGLLWFLAPLVEEILADLLDLEGRCRHLIVISSDVSGEIGSHSLETMAYLQGMGMLHERLAVHSQRVVELVYGLPVFWKGAELSSLAQREVSGSCIGRVEGDKRGF